MEELKIRPGVILTEICGEHVLVAAKEAREVCPYVSMISESGAFIWRQISRGAKSSDLLPLVLEEYEIEDPEQAKTMMNGFIRQMLESGYLLKEGEKNEEE